MDESTETERRLVAYSKALGYLPCQVVGCNHTHYLLKIYGKDIPTPKELVFELQPGWELRRGRIVPCGRSASADDSLVAGESIPVSMIQFEPEVTPIV